MIDRHRARILAMQSLCQLEVLAEDFLPQLDEFLAEESPDAAVRDYARGLVHDTWEKRSSFDQLIGQVAEHWDLERMATVDRNAIRVAICEMLHRPEVPPRVALTEAMEIGKTFGTKDSSAFINGILDAIMTKMKDEREGKKDEKEGTKDGGCRTKDGG
jgi:N utilization substance protein B